MRLHRLEISAFLAFGGTEIVDFDELSDAGLFLLQGPTGAGKSSILDAVCFALFGSISEQRPGAEELRSHHAAAGLKTSVTLELTLRDRRLRIVRSPKQQRPKLRGEGTTPEPHKLTILELTGDGEQPLASTTQEATAELADLIAMSREQFRQVVMLPQGGFAQVLHADSADRERLLRGLFDVRRFSAVERWLKEQATSAKAARQQAEARISDVLLLAAHNAQAEPCEDEDPAHWLAAQAESAAAQRDTDSEQRTALADQHRLASRRLTEASERNRVVEAAALAAGKAEAALDAAGYDAATDLQRLRADAAQRREAAGATRALIPQEQALTEARASLADLSSEQARYEQRANAARVEHERLLTERPEREQALVRAREAKAMLDGLIDAHEQAKRRALAGAERDGIKLAIASLDADLADLRERSNAAERSHLELLRAHLDGYAATLAEQLEDGAPCMVCGSLDHPAPHDAGDIHVPSKGEVDQAGAEAERAIAARDRAVQQIAERRSDLASAIAIAGEAASEQLSTAVDEAAQAHALAAATAGRVQPLTTELDRLQERLAELVAEAQEAKEHAASCRSAHAAAVANADALERQLTEARADEDSVADRAETLAREAALIESAADAVEEARAARELAGDAEAVELAELSAAEQAVEQELAAVTERLALQSERATKLGELVEGYAQAVLEAAPLIERHELLAGLHEFADGTAISNEKRMRLTVFVLAARLEQVAAAATLRLEKMSRGRYSLVHSDAHRGRKARGGLDLRVFDAYTGCERAPNSLSGGETFYASLALALGLADVISAEAGGARLDTLFIDEGFGTLDDEGTLDNVLDVLDELRAGGRAVGVVSHVRELRDRISAQLRVQPGTGGSQIIQGTHEITAASTPSLSDELKQIDAAIATGHEPLEIEAPAPTSTA